MAKILQRFCWIPKKNKASRIIFSPTILGTVFIVLHVMDPPNFNKFEKKTAEIQENWIQKLYFQAQFPKPYLRGSIQCMICNNFTKIYKIRIANGLDSRRIRLDPKNSPTNRLFQKYSA